MFYIRHYRTVKKLGNPKKNRPLAGRCKMWLRNISFGRVREVLDLLELGKNVSNLMQRLRIENVSTQQKSDKNT